MHAAWAKQGVLQQRDCELQVNNIEEIKQQLVELWQDVKQHLSKKVQCCCFCVLPGNGGSISKARWGNKTLFD